MKEQRKLEVEAICGWCPGPLLYRGRAFLSFLYGLTTVFAVGQIFWHDCTNCMGVQLLQLNN